jgi:Ca2+-binding RTX toxin-like protein
LGTIDDNPTVPVPDDRSAFLRGTGAYSTVPVFDQDGNEIVRNQADIDGVTRTGLGNVDFWVGGLAERQMPFGGLLGSTFNYVFESQMEKLQDGDRFYYLHRTAGLNFLTALEENSFSKIIAQNTDAKHLPLDVFSRPDLILEVGQLHGDGSTPITDEPSSPDDEQAHLTRMLDGTLRFAGGEHVLIGGGPNSDRIRVDDGDDTILGDGGNDRIEGGAGNDGIEGGDGDDILTDTFGIDNIKADGGNDVVSAGSGTGDLSFGGPGKDAIFGGADDKEEFLGLGDDFVKGSTGISTIFGNEGDDWIEGGAHADLLQGGNGAPFQDDGALPNPANPNIAPTHTGNDVIIGDSGNDDYDSEGGDDIMVAGPGIERNEGMFGFDWVTGTRDPQAAQMDMRFTGLLPPDVDAIRDRFDLVEGLSGYDQNDVLRGDDRSGAPVVEEPGTDDMTGHELARAAQINLIDGLGGLLSDAGRTTVDDGNILLGGAGSDLIEGRGGNDIIDGDRWLDVELTAPGEAAPFDSITDVQSRLLSGNLNPADINIQRSIKTGADSPDTAVFSENRANYDIDSSVPGRVVINHSRGGGVAGTPGIDGEDTLINVEFIQFADSLVSVGSTPTNGNTEGTVTIAGLSANTPTEGVALTASIVGLSDPEGIASTSFSFESEIAPNVFAPLGSGASFTPGDAAVGTRLRVVATIVDGAGVTSQLVSAPTEPVQNVNDVPTGSLDIDRQDARVGRQLTASLGTVVDADGPNPLTGLSYRWQRNSPGGFVDILTPDAGDETYTPVVADIPQSLRVKATYTDAHGTVETVFSQPTLTTRNVTGGRAALLVLGRTLVPGTLAANAVGRTGLTVALTAPATTNLVRVRVFKGNAKASLARVFVKVKPGKNKVALRHGVIVNALKRGGVFRVEVTPGTSRTNLGTPTWRTITVKKAAARK